MAMEDDAAIGSESVDPDLALLYRDISQFKDADIPRAAALIAAISLVRSSRAAPRSVPLPNSPEERT